MTTLQLNSGAAASASLTTSIVNPILQSTIETFDLMLDCKVVRKGLSIKTHDTPFFGITAVISLMGEGSGSICLSFPNTTAFEAIRRMTDLEFTEVTSMVCDAVGEFANVIAGSAKDKITQLSLELGIPTVVRGDNHLIEFPSNSQPMCIDYDSDIGPFMIAFGFVQK